MEDGIYCQTSDAEPGESESIAVSYIDGMSLSIDTRLVEGFSHMGREIFFSDGADNTLRLTYVGHLNKLIYSSTVGGVMIYSDFIVPPEEEWDGSDGLWHNLKIEMYGDTIQAFRDDILLFEDIDPLYLGFPTTGNIHLYSWDSHTCFDNVVFLSEGAVAAQNETWTQVKIQY